MPKPHHYLTSCRHAAYVSGVASLLLSACAFAGEDGARPWTFGGFGTAGMVRSSEHAADFSATPLNPGRAGHSRAWSYDVDSRLGAQLGYSQDRWSAVVQVVVEHNLKNSYTPVVEWANVKYQVTRDLSLRVGRIALPLFLTADYRKAGYALPWVRPPVELYAALPVSNSDGIDASYRWRAFGMRNETQLLFGRTSAALSDTMDARANGLAGVSHTSRIGSLRLNATAIRGTLGMQVAPELFMGLRQFGAEGGRLASRYETDGKRATVIGLGFEYDPGQWFVMGEAGRVNARSMLGDKSAGYLSGGYRLGAWTPYGAISRATSNTPTAVNGLPTAGLPPAAAAAASALNAGLNDALSHIPVQDTASAGLRWDFASCAALKLQYDSVKTKAGTSGTLNNVQPDFRSGRRFGVSSVVVDFVF